MPRKVKKTSSKEPSSSQGTSDLPDEPGASGLHNPPQQAPQMPALAPTGLAVIASQQAVNRKLQSQRDQLRVGVLNALKASSTPSLLPPESTSPVSRRGRDYSSSDTTSDTESSTSEDSSSEEVSSKEKKKRGMGKKKKRQRHKISKRVPKRKRRDYSSSDSETTASLDDSSEERRQIKKKGKGRHFPQRVKDAEEVQQRYDVLLRYFKKCKSLKWTAKHYSIDVGTISNTAVIAEVAIAAPDVALPQQGESQTLIAYAATVRAFIDGLPEVKDTIQKMKKDRLLLPV